MAFLDGMGLQVFWSKVKTLIASHTNNKSNPHAVTTEQIRAAPVGHSHNYAGSSSAGGSANSAITCTGNSATATRATQDEFGNNIASTYARKTITYTSNIGTVWTGTAAPYTQTISINGILADDSPIIDVVLSSTVATALLQEKAWNCVSRITTSSNSITVYCNKMKPVTSIPIQLKVVR